MATDWAMTQDDPEERKREVAALKAAPVPDWDFVVASDTVTSHELQRDWGRILARVRRGNAIHVTNHGRADIVMIDHEQYEELVKTREELARRQGEGGR